MFVVGGRPFLTGGLSEARDRSPGMMLLIALALTVAFLASWGATLGVLPHDLDFWWELALLVVIMLLGHWIEMRSQMSASKALEELVRLIPKTQLSLEQALEFLREDECVEVTPRNVRLRKVILDQNERVKASRRGRPPRDRG